MLFEFYEDRTWLSESCVNHVEVNPSVSKDGFNIKKLQSTYTEADPGKQKQRDSEGLSEVQKTIEDFKKIYKQREAGKVIT